MSNRLVVLTLAGLCCTPLGCARKIAGPTPSVTALSNEAAPSLEPGVVCNAQGDPAKGWPVDVEGDGFSPMPTGVLTSTPSVTMPTVSLAGPESYAFAPARVFFVDQTRMVVDVPTADTTPAKTLTAGAYDVTVTDPDGKAATLSGGLEVVPPPTITSVTLTTPVTPTADGVVTLDGTGFRTGQAPTVTLSASGLATVTLPGVTVVSATELTATVPANTAQGTYDVTVANPEGCDAVAAAALVIAYDTLGQLTLDPPFGWAQENTAITIYDSVTGAGQKPFSGGSPQVWIEAPLTGASGGTAKIPLRRVAYVSPNVITAVVPDCSGMSATPISGATPADCAAGIAAGGPYTLDVKDPSGATGQITGNAAFTVLVDAPPQVVAISPGSITTAGVPSSQTPGFLTVTGTHFDTSDGQHSKAQIGFKVTGGTEYCDLPDAAGGTVSDTELDVDVPASIAATNCVVDHSDGTVDTAPTAGFAGTGEGEYLIRVQHLSDVGAGDYSALSITSTSYNPVAGPPIATTLAEPLDDFPLVSATDDLGNHFLYALGGTAAGVPTAHVELASISKFGDVGGACTPPSGGGTPVCTFRQLDRTAGPNQHQGQLVVGPSGTTPSAITGASAIVRTVPGDTSYLFLIGGADDSGARASVWRAQVLRNQDAPVIDDTATAASGALDAGTYDYRVSAITSDPANPGGETLPSDLSVGTLGAAGGLTIGWQCPANATRFKIYRTVAANDPAGTEKLLTTVTASCTGTPARQSFTDDGSATPAGDAPLPPGALGMWVDQSTPLATARFDAKATLHGDDVWIAGGTCTAGSTGCTAAGDLATVEHVAFGAGTATFSGAWDASGTLQRARTRMDALLAIDHAAAPNDVPAGSTFLLAVGGSSGGTLITGNGQPVLEMSPVGAGGATTWSTPTFPANLSGTIGGWAEVQADNFFIEATSGSLASPLFDGSTTGGICRSGRNCPATSVADFDFSTNAGFPPYTTGSPRYLVGETLLGAYIYTAGGASSTGAGATLTDSLERLVY